MTIKTSHAQIKAVKKNTAKALEDVRVLLGQYDTEAYEALQKIKAHHNGNRAGAIKQAIIEYAKRLEQGA
ncbi:hypothetical protein LU276_03945 [Moraxella haemolytica]|uniref:hypothetical protein n=1 Tax=Moraxella haemolytica TaxID=2904119 RepID=UPI00254299D9|nr:hypothetical protein [Moraxella sp. ZY171148]WII95975.1 hypothetical protein LU276_03945 [Moraxella sp. ZY171148]